MKNNNNDLFDLQHTATVGTDILGTVISHSPSSPAPDHLLQPSPSTPSTPHLQLRIQKQKQTKRGFEKSEGPSVSSTHCSKVPFVYIMIYIIHIHIIMNLVYGKLVKNMSEVMKALILQIVYFLNMNM